MLLRSLSNSGRSNSPTLPTKSFPSTSSVFVPRRYARLVLLGLLSLCALVFLYYRQARDASGFLIPPRYEKYHEYEENLPQHNLDLPYPEGRDAKYFWASNHVTHSGWGNFMQELLMNAHLAYATNRAFVFDNFTWDKDGPEFSIYNGKPIPARTPLSSMITGPIIGDPFPPGDDVPRAVSKNFFNRVCPNPKIIKSSEVNNDYIRFSNEVGARKIFDLWVEKLNSIEDPCVQIHPTSLHLFEIWVFGTPRILDIWPMLKTSPIITNFGWSPLIHSAFVNNLHLFQPVSWSPWDKSSHYKSIGESSEPLPGLLVLHIRQGDFDKHCLHFAKWRSAYNGFNCFPELVDKFSVPPGSGDGKYTEEARDIYLKHCFPSIPQIVEKVGSVTKTSKGLKNIYVMTNASPAWLDELKLAFRKMEGHEWQQIAGSRDLKLNWEQKYVAHAVDMMIAGRAQVFIGNGFSSLTSNIVLLRMAKDLPSETNRFW